MAPQANGDRERYETAAQHASLEVPIVRADQQAGDVRLALQDRTFESASHIIVCDGDRFLGVVRIEALLAAPADATLGVLMDREAPVVGPGSDQEVAAWTAVRRGESALAVVTSDGRFAGVIPPHRLLAVLLSEHEEDLSRLGGFTRTTAVARMASEEPVPRRFQHRLPWLLVGLAGALVAADLVASFEAQLTRTVMLAFFIPGLVYLADAVGTQTETVIVRGLSVGVAMRQMVGRELLVGVATGVALAAIAGPFVWWRWGDPAIAATVGLSVFAACSTATLAAMALPWLLDAAGLDPAFGSGPLATVIQDLLSILIYFYIAAAIM